MYIQSSDFAKQIEMCGIATWIYFTILGDKKEQK